MSEMPFVEPGERRWILSLPSGGRIDLLILGAEPEDLEIVQSWLDLINKYAVQTLTPRPAPPEG